MSDSDWFRKKHKGYGWTPNNWKGWCVTVIAILLIIALTRSLIAAFV